MTVKDAHKKFGISEKEIRKRKKDGMIIGAKTINHRIKIPDNTEIIPSKKEIQSFLFQIIKYKNNNGLTISRSLCPDEESLNAVMNFLYKKGFVGGFVFSNDINVLFSDVSLTDDGIAFVFGKSKMSSIDGITCSAVALNPTINVFSIDIG